MASEPRVGQADGTHEHICRGGEAERYVSWLKRCGGCFQFLLLRLNRQIKGIQKKFLQN